MKQKYDKMEAQLEDLRKSMKFWKDQAQGHSNENRFTNLVETLKSKTRRNTRAHDANARAHEIVSQDHHPESLLAVSPPSHHAKIHTQADANNHTRTHSLFTKAFTRSGDSLSKSSTADHPTHERKLLPANESDVSLSELSKDRIGE